ncbi:uncharacterized protein F5891DRAFT_984968 [Suillus fuscotomentosus]|uniref:Uncharacterized protein n=1 Tax=Suillus fuscotomentosus TaxID=1912939 RepID=A0AAD4HFD0_9AGAM|nr:uncharacterized protein F5891DRAFT_984968 [Suillus fuscotomentosus]KAG1894462.1 hypothetical protein F5891DRAFT_984968 [Suillus fuscotomentosus]
MSPMIATVSHPPAGGSGTLPNPYLKLGIHHADPLTSGPKKNQRAEMLVGLAIGMNTQTLGLKSNAELTNLAVDDEHITLIGLGGMGKSSPAKAIINKPPAMEKFADGRVFVTYDSLDPSSITFETHDSFCGSPMHRTCWC